MTKETIFCGVLTSGWAQINRRGKKQERSNTSEHDIQKPIRWYRTVGYMKWAVRTIVVPTEKPQPRYRELGLTYQQQQCGKRMKTNAKQFIAKLELTSKNNPISLFGPFAILKKIQFNNCVCICTGTQVLTYLPQILRRVWIWAPFRVPYPEYRVKQSPCFRIGRQ